MKVPYAPGRCQRRSAIRVPRRERHLETDPTAARAAAERDLWEVRQLALDATTPGRRTDTSTRACAEAHR